MKTSEQNRTGTDAINAPRERIAELQNPLDRWLYHRISRQIATALAHTPVTPNMVSLAGGLMIVLAGIAYTQPGWPLPALLGLAIHMSWHILDGADGDLARLTGRTSPVGEVVDGICDYAGHVALYLLLAASTAASVGPITWALVVAAGLSRILQANFHEAQRRQYIAWVYGVPWLRTTDGAARDGIAGYLARAYLAISDRIAPGDASIDRAVRDPNTAADMRVKLRAIGPAGLAGSSLLGSNYRTIGLGISMLAGSPLWYFLAESTVMNLLLAQAVVRSRNSLREARTGL